RWVLDILDRLVDAVELLAQLLIDRQPAVELRFLRVDLGFRFGDFFLFRSLRWREGAHRLGLPLDLVLDRTDHAIDQLAPIRIIVDVLPIPLERGGLRLPTREEIFALFVAVILDSLVFLLLDRCELVFEALQQLLLRGLLLEFGQLFVDAGGLRRSVAVANRRRAVSGSRGCGLPAGRRLCRWRRSCARLLR